MVPAFNQACIDTKTGKVTLAETPFGFHVIKVTGKKDKVKKVKVKNDKTFSRLEEKGDYSKKTSNSVI